MLVVKYRQLLRPVFVSSQLRPRCLVRRAANHQYGVRVTAHTKANSLCESNRSQGATHEPTATTAYPDTLPRDTIAKCFVTKNGRDGEAATATNGRAQRSATRITPTYPRTNRVSRHARVAVDQKAELENGGWRKRLESFEQLDFESDVENPIGRTQRLVDHDFLQSKVELWESILAFRQRAYGDDGAKTIWRRLKAIRYTNTPDLHTSRALVETFINTGFRDHGLLKDFCQFLSDLHRLTGKTPYENFDVYCTVLLHVLRTRPKEAQMFHSLLYYTAPTKDQLCDLVIRLTVIEKASSSQPMLETLESFCFDILSWHKVYDRLIPIFCEHGIYETALRWHRLLMKRDDYPSSSLSVEPLIAYLEKYGRRRELLSIIEEVRAHIQPTNETPRLVAEQEREEFNEAIKRLEQRSPLSIVPVASISDEFCAKLLATRFFSLKTIISGLKMLQVQKIGPLAMRQILIRTVIDDQSGMDQVREHLALLTDAGILLDRSKFCRLVQKLVIENNIIMLYDVVKCDQHPDELEDWKLQEQLLLQYHRSGDRRQFDRTIAVLLLDTNTSSYDIRYMNTFLRIALNEQDDDLLLQLLEEMRFRGLPVNHNTRAWMFHKMMPERIPRLYERRLVPPRTSIDRYINSMKYIMQGGTPIAPGEWDDVLRTLLFGGYLYEFEDLLIYLLTWYTDPEFRASESAITGKVKHETFPSEYGYWHQFLRSSRVAEIVIFGAYHASWKTKPNIRMVGDTVEERANALAQHPSFWGLRLLARLRDLGFPVDREHVYEACIRRLGTMFSIGNRDRKRNRVIARKKLGNVQDYATAMEKVWGNDLFQRESSIDDFCKAVIDGSNMVYYIRIKKLLLKMQARRWSAIRIYNNRYDSGSVKWNRKHLEMKVKQLEDAGFSYSADDVISRRDLARKENIVEFKKQNLLESGPDRNLGIVEETGSAEGHPIAPDEGLDKANS